VVDDAVHKTWKMHATGLSNHQVLRDVTCEGMERVSRVTRLAM